MGRRVFTTLLIAYELKLRTRFKAIAPHDYSVNIKELEIHNWVLEAILVLEALLQILGVPSVLLGIK
jgi:hypothetical protein